MKRIDIRYGGQDYTVADRDLPELMAEIAAAFDSGATYWLEVNEGRGIVQQAQLALTPGTSIALTPVADPDPA